MNLETENTWPQTLRNYLDKNLEMLMAYAQHEEADSDRVVSGQTSADFLPPNPFSEAHEQATIDVVTILQHTTLRGWHCTRLTTKEVDHIKQHGMQLPSQAVLQSRIKQVQNDGLITADIAKRLNLINQADDHYRKGMIWFCFFPPFKGDQHGIERFFRRWGGEALYNSHESDPVTGTALTKIGKPCLIEANVPVSSFPKHTYLLGEHLIRRYLIQRGLKTEEPIDHENRVLQPLPPENIVRIIQYGDEDFTALTGCNQWSPTL